MTNFDERMITIWLVQLGKMFYAGNLTRNSNSDESFSYEVVHDEKVASAIIYKHIAIKIAEKCGGVVIERHLTPEEFNERQGKFEAYMDSQRQIVKDVSNQPTIESFQQNNIREILKKSFLHEFIEQGLMVFQYLNGDGFFGRKSGSPFQKLKVQPKKTEIKKLVNEIAEVTEKELNWTDSMKEEIVQYPIEMSIYCKNKHFIVTIVINHNESLK